MYFKVSQVPQDFPFSNAKLLPSFEDPDKFEYIGPHEFDPEVDLELKDKLANLAKQPDNSNVIDSRKDSSLFYKISFMPLGPVGSPVLVSFTPFFLFL